MIPVHARRPARELGRPDSEVEEGSWVDSGGDGRESRDRQEFSGGCGAREKERIHPQFGFDGKRAEGFLVPTVLTALIVGHSLGGVTSFPLFCNGYGPVYG